MTPGYRALREGLAWADLSARGRIKAIGEDRVRLLHAMSSNHVQRLVSGQGMYTFFLNAQGRILADAGLMCFEDHLLLSTEPETRGSLYEHLDKYIIADDVILEDVTGTTVEIAVEGPAANAPAGLPQEPWNWVSQGERIVARASATGRPGYRIVAPAAERDAIVAGLTAAGASEATAEDIRTVRLEEGVPRYGEDFSDRHLPHETQLLHAVHFDKGCYLGQEIVERVRSRGNVHRQLMRIAAAEPLPPGTKILAEGREAGEVTSMAFSPALGRAVGLAFVRVQEAGGALRAGDTAIEITATRPGP